MKNTFILYIVLTVFACNFENHQIGIERSRIVILACHTVFEGEEWSVINRGKIIFFDKVSTDTGYYNREFIYTIASTTMADTLTVFCKIKDSVLVLGKLLVNQSCDSIEIVVSMPFPAELNPYDSTIDFSDGFKFGKLNPYNSRRLIRVFPKEKTRIIFYNYP